MLIFPGKRLRVHEPEEGRPLRITLPVGELHVGAVIVPGTGAVG